MWFELLLAALTLIANGFALCITENFGLLVDENQVSTSGHGALTGPYGSTLMAFSVLSLGFGVLYLVYSGYRLFRSSWKKVELTYLLPLIVGVVSAALQLYFVENFAFLEDLTFDPPVPIQNQNYKLRGPFGVALVAISSISTFFSGVAVLGIVTLKFVPHLKL